MSTLFKMPPKKKKKELTLREKTFIDIATRTLNPKKAAEIAYNLGSKGGKNDKQHKDNVASVIAHENLRKPKIKEAMDELLENRGINKELIIVKFKELLDCGNPGVERDMVDMYMKLINAYPEAKLRIGKLDEFADILAPHPDNLSEEIPKIKEENMELRNKLKEMELLLKEKDSI